MTDQMNPLIGPPTNPYDNSVHAIYKPKGITSAKFLNHVKLILGIKKMGHAGTLDPNATGILVIGTGRSTKLLNQYMLKEKTYVATIMLGSTSDTMDDCGVKTWVSDTIPDQQSVIDTINRFIGTIDQIPPRYSAILINGKRAYDLARRNQEFTMQSRKVTVHAIDCIQYQYPIIRIKVRCSSGTYIRSLANDLGNLMGTGAYLLDLERTVCGGFEIKDCLDLTDINLLSGEGLDQDSFNCPIHE